LIMIWSSIKETANKSQSTRGSWLIKLVNEYINRDEYIWAFRWTLCIYAWTLFLAMSGNRDSYSNTLLPNFCFLYGIGEGRGGRTKAYNRWTKAQTWRTKLRKH
jgi:hypothetical protein